MYVYIKGGKFESYVRNFNMTFSPIHWVQVNDKGSKILCAKFGAMKIIPSDHLHRYWLLLVTDNSCSCH